MTIVTQKFMGKKNKITLTDIFLFIAAGIIDLYQEIKDPFDLFSKYYQTLYGEVPSRWRKTYFRSIFTYSVKKGYLKKDSNLNTGKLFLTKKGEFKLKRKYPQIFYKNKSDNRIRLAIFDIQELNRYKRNQLIKLLKQIGFVMIQKSVWATLFDQFKLLKRWIRKNDLEDKVILIEIDEKNIKSNNKSLLKWLKSSFFK